jgi:thioredoxin reductase (NADPH)
MFPLLAADEIARLHRFGKPRRFADGAHVIETGKVSPGIYVVLTGAIRVTGRDGHGHELPVTEHGPGHFSGELSQLSRRPSFVDGIGSKSVFPQMFERARNLIDGSLVVPLEEVAAAVRLLAERNRVGGGRPGAGRRCPMDVARLRSFLSRNGIPISR